jgi:hypothetical protein
MIASNLAVFQNCLSVNYFPYLSHNKLYSVFMSHYCISYSMIASQWIVIINTSEQTLFHTCLTINFIPYLAHSKLHSLIASEWLYSMTASQWIVIHEYLRANFIPSMSHNKLYSISVPHEIVFHDCFNSLLLGRFCLDFPHDIVYSINVPK